jgi:FkbM family methyltransferase
VRVRSLKETLGALGRRRTSETHFEHRLARMERRISRLDDRLSTIIRQLRAIEQNATRQIGRLDYGDGQIQLGVTSRTELLSRIRPKTKEPWTVRWIERRLADNDVLWDVGANVGGYSLIAAYVARGARVVAAEPGFANYAALCDNIALNSLGGRVLPLPVALAGQTGLVALNYDDLVAGGGNLRIDSTALGASAEAIYTQPVLAYRLDDLVERFDVPAPTLLKIDVEGAELEVLDGARRALARAELRGILVEVSRAHDAELRRFLSGYGFELVERIDSRNGKRMELVWYGIFERQSGSVPSATVTP